MACTASNDRLATLPYEPSTDYPYGRPNPEAPAELSQFAFMIGANDCTEERLNNSTGEWDTGVRTWDAKYYMNGYAISDTGRSGKSNNGNIRIYDPATEQWVVTYFSMPVFGTGTWRGGLVNDELVLEQPQRAPGTELEGVSRLTFSDISAQGFNWTGAWVSNDDPSLIFPFWRISCSKRN